jgi:hypothetical protein
LAATREFVFQQQQTPAGKAPIGRAIRIAVKSNSMIFTELLLLLIEKLVLRL